MFLKHAMALHLDGSRRFSATNCCAEMNDTFQQAWRRCFAETEESGPSFSSACLLKSGKYLL